MATMGNIMFYANDPRRLSHFWSGVFGYPLQEWDEPHQRDSFLESGLTEQDLEHRAPRRRPRMDAVPGCSSTTPTLPRAGAIACTWMFRRSRKRQPTREQLDAEKDRLVALGATVVRLVDQTLGRVARAVLPDAGSRGERVLPAVSALLDRGCGGQLDRNDRAVLPQALEPVVHALLLVEDVHDEIAEVQQHPARLLAPFAAQALVARLEQLVLDLVRDRGDVALAATR